ncbi:MAG: class I SAM-dependent methyltransferase [Victivallales bacterium]|mgnify:CR=1 FL=1|jgi:SAM-dependent methyltransferase|nr:class I SAM-dependent methyltransferase [Victivallales bacterium]
MSIPGSPENYFIKDGYEARDVSLTLDSVSGGVYWDEERIAASEHFQYDVYMYAAGLVERTGASRLLDIGCGAARKLRMIHELVPDLEIVGVDQPHAIEFCCSQYGFGRWVAANIEDSEDALGSEFTADVVVCADVIEHLVNPDSLLDYIRAHAHEDTRVVLSTPERDVIRGRKCMRSRNKQHVREWNIAEFRAYLEHRGFVVLEQFLQYPVRVCWSRLFYKEVVRRWLKLKRARYNQVCVVRPGHRQ